jgi:hypothetical protein
MAHVRKQIRVAVATALTGLSTTGARVYVERVYPLERSSLPGLVVMTHRDDADLSLSTEYASGVNVWSNLELIVKGYAKNTSTVENDLDQIELEVRQALANTKTLGGLSKDLNWLSTQILIDATGEQPVGIVEMTFGIVYRVKDNAVGTAIS